MASIDVSGLKLLAIQVETLFAAWQSSALSPAYMQKMMTELSGRMKHLEAEELAPPGWRATWDRYENQNRFSPYYYSYYYYHHSHQALKCAMKERHFRNQCFLDNAIQIRGGFLFRTFICCGAEK